MALAVGDIFAIIDKAWALYEILKESRSSKTQYRDLQNQLRSLYEVLLSVKEVQHSGRLEAPSDPEVSAPDETKHAFSLAPRITSIIQNCGESLDHLFEIFDKYRILGLAPDSKRKSFMKVKQFLGKKEREIQFTTEREDLDSLRIQVLQHTNSLGLLVNLVIKSVSSSPFSHLQSLTNPPMKSSQANRIETRTSHIASQTARIEAQNIQLCKWVEEIYAAWHQSLQVSKEDSIAASDRSRPSSTDSLFSISEDDKPSSSIALCENAGLYPVHEPGDSSASAQLFRCCCDGHAGRNSSRHRQAVEAYNGKNTLRRHSEDSRWI